MALRLLIDGDWNAADFAAFFTEIDRFYEFTAAQFRILAFAPTDDERFVARMAAISSPIRVRTIQYGSPGFTDLVGLGALTKELREFLQFLILHFREREDRKLTREERRIQITRARLDLMEKLMEIRKSGSRDGLLERSASSSEFLELPKFDEIALAITEGRLTDVLEIDDDEKGKK